MADVKFARGYQTDYDAKLNSSEIDDDTLYFITDSPQKLYLGTILISQNYPDGDSQQYGDSNN